MLQSVSEWQPLGRFPAAPRLLELGGLVRTPILEGLLEDAGPRTFGGSLDLGPGGASPF